MARLLVPDAELERMVLNFPQVTERVAQVAEAVADEARAQTREHAHDTGLLLSTIHVADVPGNMRRVRMAAGPGQPDMLPVWVNKGTGVYGARRRPIRPKKPGGVLVFKVKDGGNADGMVFAREVKGRPATPVMRDAGVTVANRLGLRWRPSNT